MAFLASPDGVKLWYELEGSGPPVLLHLGAGCDSDLWRAAGYVAGLSDRFGCILFDHRGHGRSDRPPGPEANHIDRYVADVIELLDHLGLASCAFWGYSNGIAVGLRLADGHGTRLRALVGSGTIGMPPTSELTVTVERAILNLREHGWERMIRGFEEEEVEPVPEWMKERIRATAVEQLIEWNMARLNWNWSAWDSLHRVATPTLFLVGALEDPDDLMAKAVSIMPDATRLRVPGLGHINAFLRSELVLEKAMAFLDPHST